METTPATAHGTLDAASLRASIQLQSCFAPFGISASSSAAQWIRRRLPTATVTQLAAADLLHPAARSELQPATSATSVIHDAPILTQADPFVSATGAAAAAAPSLPLPLTPAKHKLSDAQQEEATELIDADSDSSDVVEIAPPSRVARAVPDAALSSRRPLPPFKKTRRRLQQCTGAAGSNTDEEDCQIIEVERKIAVTSCAASNQASSAVSSGIASSDGTVAGSAMTAWTTSTAAASDGSASGRRECEAVQLAASLQRNVPPPVELSAHERPPAEDEQDDFQPPPSSNTGCPRVDCRALLNAGNRCWQVTSLPRVLTDEERSVVTSFVQWTPVAQPLSLC
jgi:hypothetical protein